MREVKYIAVHCSATAQSAKVEDIQKYWREHLGWTMPGYHFIVLPNGTTVELLSIDKVSNGVKGYNSVTVNVCYIGGIDANQKPIDNRTPQQKTSLLQVITKLKKQFPKAIVQGHRDFPNVSKACPCFNAKSEYKSIA